jgi:hypothetical protein
MRRRLANGRTDAERSPNDDCYARLEHRVAG